MKLLTNLVTIGGIIISIFLVERAYPDNNLAMYGWISSALWALNFLLRYNR